jgi:VWFA-related protein
MRKRRLVFLMTVIILASCWMLLAPGSGHSLAYAQQAPAPGAGDVPVIRAETRLVLVDTVVTDKKGNYIRDLSQNDFKVWEDGKEQTLTSFSFEKNSGSSSPQPHYLVLFFDNSTMDMPDQAKARDAAAKFIDANGGPDRLIAIVDFGGSVRISQNFTSNTQRLKQVVKGTKGSFVQPSPDDSVMVASLSAPPAAPSLANAEADFGVRSVLQALRSLAQGLSTVPGRKTLVMLTSGFPLTVDYASEVSAVIDTCNKANVAIYPIDARGLTVPDISPPQSRLARPAVHAVGASLAPAAFHTSNRNSHRPSLRLAAFAEPAEALPPQHGGGGGGGGGGGHGGGGTGGGGTGGGGHGGTGGTGGGTTGGKTGGGGLTNAYNTNYGQPAIQPRIIVPQPPPSASDNQQVLYQLADGTGGFVILNTNDLLGGLQRIANDQDQYYLLGYKPAVSTDGSCHGLKVKVERAGTTVRARSGYCNVKPKDLLAGNPIEKDLETRGGAEMKGNVDALMQTSFFYTAPNIARVHLAVEIPSTAVKFEKVKGKEHGAVNILGIAYNQDGSIAARFSDTANIDFEDKKGLEAFQKQPLHYQSQFGIASGGYKLRVVFSSGSESFGKLEMPLSIDAYQGKEFSISGIALSNDIRRAADFSADLGGEMLEDRTPLLVQGFQVVPSASYHFMKTDNAAVYAEVYEPLLKTANPPEVAYEIIVTERKSGQEKYHVGDRTPPPKAGNPVIPLGLKLPVATLGPGSYHVVLRAVDSVGNFSKNRSADFEVE